MSSSLFGSLSTDAFLQEHWQQKPLLVRQAVEVDGFELDPAELAGLSCDTEAPSRIVIEHGKTPWQMKVGPFEEEDFTSLPSSNWSLLINDIETYLPELQAFIEPFRFLPDWRIDDLMISYATDQGSVGPHVDEYDVFLIQLQGTRSWSIDDNPDFDTSILADTDLKILQNFQANQQWELVPGDMLYLPPGVPHHGVAIGDCMTLSIGFRAPSSGELIQAWLDDISDNDDFKVRFNDAKRKSQTASGELASDDYTGLKALLMQGIKDNAPMLDEWLGKYLTEGKRPDPVLVEAFNSVSTGSEQSGFSADTDYQRFPGTRLAYIKGDSEISLFAGGVAYPLAPSCLDALDYLCREQEYPASELASLATDPAIHELLDALIKTNKLVLMDHASFDNSEE